MKHHHRFEREEKSSIKMGTTAAVAIEMEEDPAAPVSIGATGAAASSSSAAMAAFIMQTSSTTTTTIPDLAILSLEDDMRL